MKAQCEYDIVVIGSGPAGQKAAIQAAKHGCSVAVVERQRTVGGACVHYGTIPSKTLRESAVHLARLKQQADSFHVELREDLQVATLIARQEEVLRGHVLFMIDQLQRNQVDVYHGQARLLDPHHVEVVNVRGHAQIFAADAIVIATGSTPRAPANIPVDHENILDSDSILSMIYLPRSLTVLGGGVIASEYASIFQAFGTQVTMIDRAPRPLAFLDPDISSAFVSIFQSAGGRYLPDRGIESARWDGLSKVVTVLEGGESVHADKLLVAVGRVANLKGLDIEKTGVQRSPRGHIVVDAHCRTAVPSIYAIGDVIGPPALASYSMEQGRRAMCHYLGLDAGREAEACPMGIYTIPEIACVGKSEDEAKQLWNDVRTGVARFDEVARGVIANAQGGFLKLVAQGPNHELVGVQIVGEGATDLVHVGQVAILNRNKAEIFVENVLNFPTLAEAYRIAALKLVNAPLAPRRARTAPAEATSTNA